MSTGVIFEFLDCMERGIGISDRGGYDERTVF